MMHASKTRSIRAVAFLAAVCAAVALTTASAIPARAAEPVFPVGSRLGIVPPPDMIPSPAFSGFADPNKDAAILLVTFPPVAFDQLDKSMVPAELKKQGIDVDQREPIELGFGKGFVVRARQTTERGRYRKWLLVVAANDLRASVPDAERLSLLPFKVGDMAGFRIDDVLPGRALMLIDVGAGQAATQHTHFLIAAMEGGPNETQDRDEFARVTFGQISGLKDVQIQDAEPLRIGGQAGYETLATAKDGKSDSNVRVVQWLRFGSGSYMQMIGVSPADQWPDVFARLRAVRDSVNPK
jgi:hypothetical protein